MSDKPISKGDLVMVVRSIHSCADKYLGYISTVVAIHETNGVCSACNQRVLPDGARGYELDGKCVVPVGCVKRLDPDTLMDDVPTGEELKV